MRGCFSYGVVCPHYFSSKKYPSSGRTEKGYNVSGATSAGEGIEKERSFQPDVIILDIRLPDRDGLEVLGELQKDYSEKKIIIITVLSTQLCKFLIDRQIRTYLPYSRGSPVHLHLQ